MMRNRSKWGRRRSRAPSSETTHADAPSSAIVTQARASGRPFSVRKYVRREEPGATVLDVSFGPTRGTAVFLKSAYFVFIGLLAASLWARSAPIMIATLMAILAFPFVVVAYGSRREAEESTLRKKIRKAIVEEEDQP